MLIFFDLEVNQESKRIDLIGLATESNRRLETKKEDEMYSFIKKNKGKYFVGHNIVNHDLKYFKNKTIINTLNQDQVIDTLMLSTLIFSNKPYHYLVKDDKLDTKKLNNPVNDAINSRILFFDIVAAFKKLDRNLKDIYFLLLKDVNGFRGFFNYLKYKPKNKDLVSLIKTYYQGEICQNANLNYLIDSYKIELGYALSLIQTTEAQSLLPAWVLKTYSKVESVLKSLRGTPCDKCDYCLEHLNAEKALLTYYNYPSFRKFAGVDLQKNAVNSALKGESLIAVFPTGGGKSLTFQLPAIMNARGTRGLTVVISPLQSLMKDQVDSLEEKNINVAVAISGMLDPIERKKAIEQVRDGRANILYIAPESLRSSTIERLLLSRQITRIVIDEAHCFSTWGHDFRVDYLYIAEFIKKIQKAKGLQEPIPISCFTATAKVDVIDDIKRYFYERLNLELKEFTTTSTRTNLSYSISKVNDDFERYSKLRNLLSEKDTPTIIYCSRIKTVKALTEKLNRDEFRATMFHGRLDKDVKVQEQERFMNGEINIMVATSAFGMGIDKDNIERVIHYEISDSLENYIQEAGRAGRDQKIFGECYIFFNEDDLNKHFELLNSSKLNLSEINQLWRGIKQATKERPRISKSALELANDAGWNDEGFGIETKVKTAVSTLEEVGYIKRGHNTHRVYADSLLAKSVIEAKQKIMDSNLFTEEENVLADRIIQNLISNKYKGLADGEVGETRIDYLSDITGASKENVIKVINKFREIGILSNENDIYAHIKYETTTAGPRRILNNFKAVVSKLFELFVTNNQIHFNYKQFKNILEENNIKIDIRSLKRTINYLNLSKAINVDKLGIDDLKIKINNDYDVTTSEVSKLIDLADLIIGELYRLAKDEPMVKKENLLPFSVIQLKKIINQKQGFIYSYETKDIEDAIYLLTKINALKIEGGFLVIYSPLNIERVETNPNKQYTQDDYETLKRFYETKKEQIHIVGEYARKMIENSDSADQFVKDYFTMEYEEFLNKYFKGRRKKEISRNMTPKRFEELFGSLSKEQRDVILDNKNDRIGVAAGPGSGKTKLLVHKLASILSTEDTKTQELLMLTFSRAAAIEFKERLFKLIGSTAYYVHITTFHSYAFDITENLGNEEAFNSVIKEATDAINNNLADPFKITKSVLVIDEAQDMTEAEYKLVEALVNFNDGIRIIAVGDDDQNIFEWRGSSSKYLKEIANNGKFYELTTNFRSKNNLVKFANLIAENITDRQKKSEIKSYTNEDGIIETYKYDTYNIITPLVNKIIEDQPHGRTCVITKKNDDAIMINGLLNEAGFKTSLIQDYDDFRLFDMLEFRTFYEAIKERTEHRIDNEVKEKAFYELKKKHSKSKNYHLVRKTLNNLLKNHNEFYLSDLNSLLFETMYYDLYDKNSLVVSTFHKAKGKEFDNVYILSDIERITKDDDRRTFYVGVTRAKSFLSIHSKMNFSGIKYNNINHYEDNKEYLEPNYLQLLFSHKDLYLDYSRNYAKNISVLEPGVKLTMDEKYNIKYNDKNIARLSARGRNTYDLTIAKGFELEAVELNFLVYWYDKDNREDVLLPLPKLTFKKKLDN